MGFNRGIFIREIVIIATFCAAAAAAPVIEFHSTDVGGHSGSISYDPRYGLGGGPGGIGTGGLAVGRNIDIDHLTGIGTARNSGVTAACFSCILNFATGTAVSDGSTHGDSWAFNGGGQFTITGGFDLDGNGILDTTDIQPGTVLLTGAFSTPVTVTTPGGIDMKFSSATLINTMDDSVDAFFGAPGTGVYDGAYTQNFESARARLSNNAAHPNFQRWRFTTYGPTSNPLGMLDGRVVNTLVVPEPVSIVFSATAAGILALCLRSRRRRTAA